MAEEGNLQVGDGGISNTVEVRGFSKKTSQELMEMYFENSRRSGGGDLEEVKIRDEVAYITFKEAEVAEKVASRSNHLVDGHTLTVTLFHRLPPKPCYQNRVLIQGVNKAITEELLRNFLETKTKAEVTEFLYGEEDGNVVVTLSDNIDIVQLGKIFQECSIQGVFLKAARVAISNCILVQSLHPSTSHDVILYYFENKRRSGGGDVERVEMRIEERYCLIYFEDLSVIDRVFGQSHNVDGVDFEIHLHHECLGRRSSRKKSDLYLRMSSPGNNDSATLEDENADNQANDETSSSVSSNPENESDFVEVQKWQANDGIEPVLKLLIKYLKKQGKKTEADLSKHTVPCSMNLQLMWNFFMLTDCGKKMLDVIAANHHCKVSLSADDNFKEFFIFQVLNTQFHDKSDVKLFVNEVLNNIEICAEESLCIDTIGIDPKIQDEVRERIKAGQELANVWVEFVGEYNLVTVYTVCPKDQQQLVMQKITDIITDATESFNSHKEMVMADFMWQIVMTRFEYLKEFGLKFPSTEIIQGKNKNAFLLKGPRDEVKAVAGHLEELLKMAHKEVHEKVFSPGYQFEIFTSSEMCDYIDKSLPTLPVIWIPNQLTNEIHLFSKDPDLLKGMDKSIRGCIEERLYPLSKKHSELSSEQIQLLKELMKKHGGKTVINLSQSPTGLLLTTADDIFKDVYAAVQTIISSEIDELHLETFVPEKLDGKDEQPGIKSQISNPGTEMKYLSSEKVSDVVQKITRSLEVKDEKIFRQLIIMEHMEKINQLAKEHYVSIKVCELESKVGFVLNGLEKEVQFIYNALRLQEQKFQQDISVIAGATGKVHKQMLPNSDAAGKSGGSELSGQLLTDPGLASEDGATVMVSCEKIFLVENRSVYECMIKVVRWIKKTGLEHTVEVRELNEPPRVGFVLQGPSDRVIEMTDYMKKVQEGIITQKYSAFSVSEVSYLGTTEGKQILAKLEEKNCTIEITCPGKVTLVEDLYSGGAMGSCMMVTFIFPHNHSVILFNGEVEKWTTDIIVTPVLSPFSSRGTQTLPFSFTESTKLNMHVPLCIESNPKAKLSLIQNICATLDCTGDKQFGKVGFAIRPLGAWDLTKYIKIFLYAISDFFCKSQGITGRKVYLCTSNVDIFVLMKHSAIDYFSSSITRQNKAGDMYRVDFDASSIKEPVLLFDKIEVRVEAGELSQMEADVIVNTTSEKLDLNCGTISKSILKAAGHTIQDECKKTYPNGIRLGKVAITSGGKMKCKNIFHGALKPHSSQDWDKILKTFVDACLTLASNVKFKCIAFPALGTGTLELPRDQVAHIMTNCVKEFSSRQSHTLEKVTFVIYHKDKSTLKVFQDTILKFKPAEKEKTESSDFEIHVTGLKDKVNEVIASIKTELKVKPKTPVSGALSKEDCYICLNKVKSPQTLSCGHTFCIKCIESKPACPSCGAFHGIIYGNQPDGGEMKVTVLKYSLKGFERIDTLQIEYRIPHGKQGPNHPEPGKGFDSIYCVAYLPDTREGRTVCMLLRVAFERRLIFTFRRTSWGHVLTWNDIHHKTTLSDSGGQYGYPDSGYLKRVQEQLAAKGITEADIKLETAL